MAYKRVITKIKGKKGGRRLRKEERQQVLPSPWNSTYEFWNLYINKNCVSSICYMTSEAALLISLPPQNRVFNYKLPF